jgi:hypothetical protein
MQGMLFKCRCGAGLREIDPANADYTIDEEIFCSRRCYTIARSQRGQQLQLQLVIHDERQQELFPSLLRRSSSR